MNTVPAAVARVWYEGKRVAVERVVSAETDGESIVLDTVDGEEIVFTEESWDDLTVQMEG